MAGLSTPEQLGHPTTLAAAVLTHDNRIIVAVIAAVALAALVVAGVLVRQVLAAGEGTDSMKKIAEAVQEGAKAYLAVSCARSAYSPSSCSSCSCCCPRTTGISVPDGRCSS